MTISGNAKKSFNNSIIVKFLDIAGSVLLIIISGLAFAQQSESIKQHNRLTINNIDVALTVSAARDVGPVTRMDGSGLIIKVEIYAINRQRLPEIIQLVHAQIESNNNFWDMKDSGDASISNYFDGTGYSLVFREGPVWPVGSKLDMRLTLVIGENNYQFSREGIELLNNK